MWGQRTVKRENKLNETFSQVVIKCDCFGNMIQNGSWRDVSCTKFYEILNSSGLFDFLYTLILRCCHRSQISTPALHLHQ